MTIDDQMRKAISTLDNLAIDEDIELGIGEAMHRSLLKSSMLGSIRGGKSLLSTQLLDALITGATGGTASTASTAQTPAVSFEEIERMLYAVQVIKPRKIEDFTVTGRIKPRLMNVGISFPSLTNPRVQLGIFDDFEEPAPPKIDPDQPFWDLVKDVKQKKLRKASTGLCVDDQGQPKRNKQPNRGPVSRKDWK